MLRCSWEFWIMFVMIHVVLVPTLYYIVIGDGSCLGRPYPAQEVCVSLRLFEQRLVVGHGVLVHALFCVRLVRQLQDTQTVKDIVVGITSLERCLYCAFCAKRQYEALHGGEKNKSRTNK